MPGQAYFQGIFGLCLAWLATRRIGRCWRWVLVLAWVCAIGDLRQLFFNAQIALGELLLDLAVVLQRLAEHEEQFRAIIAREGCFDLGLAFLDPTIRQRGQFSGVAFTC